MSIYRDKKRGTFVFEFDKRINGKRIRAVKHLPKTWNQAQADAYDRQESAKLYAIASNVERIEYTIDDAIDIYLTERDVCAYRNGCNSLIPLQYPSA